MSITVIWSKLKPEVEFQYGGRSFFQTENGYITDVDSHLDNIWSADRY